MTPSLILLGTGYTLTRLAMVEARSGREVLAVTRDSARREQLERAGARVASLEEALESTAGAEVVVSIPPDAGLDSRITEALARHPPARLVYLSSTGVYGGARGFVDEDSQVDMSSPTARGRFDSESPYRALGAVVLRIAGIYGPGRGTHTRLLAGTLRLPEGGGGRISRVHVDDLVEAIRVALALGVPGASYCVADDRPAPQRETVGWLCERLGLPLPPTVPLESLHESLRGDRAVSNARLKALGWRLRYPDFVAGFTAVLEAEGLVAASGGITIRRILPEEVEAFWALRLRALREHPEAFGASLEEDAARPLDVVRARLGNVGVQVVLGAFEGSRLVGMVGLRREESRKQAHKAMVWGMYVAQEVRSRGVGRRLMAAVIEEARKMEGVERLMLATVAHNPQARGLYLSLGFQSYGVEPKALKIGETYVDEELMFLSL
ncbi:GNAT family N-acetyltransferase [Vitiosangium sp. GDMCC 1.1324]|uniref:GNAT family N-acetyltransferase n=1 Tax=Vitiosangium sp. (strain GDMCC 1.1324) TaxID=2138576 RepID=UPI000D3C7C5A|nr:GNAT family N-acetyltransferase [Vitiosangium sp. GDMCC 1.1324]PTL79264.1 nucleoside-diphosphate sugar epimerase [Vitiosangium sp. GDMCC 1.1324]